MQIHPCEYIQAEYTPTRDKSLGVGSEVIAQLSLGSNFMRNVVSTAILFRDFRVPFVIFVFISKTSRCNEGSFTDCVPLYQ